MYTLTSHPVCTGPAGNSKSCVIIITFCRILLPNCVILSSIVLDFVMLCKPISEIISAPMHLTSLKSQNGVDLFFIREAWSKNTYSLCWRIICFFCFLCTSFREARCFSTSCTTENNQQFSNIMHWEKQPLALSVFRIYTAQQYAGSQAQFHFLFVIFYFLFLNFSTLCVVCQWAFSFQLMLSSVLSVDSVFISNQIVGVANHIEELTWSCRTSSSS